MSEHETPVKHLNLTEGFSWVEPTPEEPISFEQFTFKGGEPHIKLALKVDTKVDGGYGINVAITHRINDFNDFGILAIAVDALKRSGHVDEIYLFLPYFPGARQDRVMVEGEPLTAKVYADLVNNLELEEVVIFDPHSDVTPALINNCRVINNHSFVRKALHDIYPEIGSHTPYLVSPDAGSNKKVLKLQQYLSFYCELDVIKCDKTRDVKDGTISGFEVYADDLKGRDCIIVDDICDGGGTFIGLAEELKKKNAGKLYLVISHGIFSQGLHPFYKHFEHIYCTNSIGAVGLMGDEFNEIITELKIRNA